MKKWFIIATLLLGCIRTSAQELELKKYLNALKTLEFDESKRIIEDLSFSNCKQYTISSFEDVSGITFETDIKGVKAYKAIFNCKAKNKLGTFIDKRMMSVSYFDKTSKKWRIFDMREPVTPCDEFQYAKKNIDISGAQYSWQLVSYWALMCGKLLDAKDAIETSESRARAINDKDFINPYKIIINRIE